MSIVISPCSHEAAKFAVTRWHYSRTMPVGKSYKLGIWESDKFVGAIIFSWGANRNLASAYNLEMTECVELVRVACTSHEAPVSQYVAAALKRLKADNPGLRLVISFADPYRGHHGGIYQAGNWLYLGETAPKFDYVMPDGRVLNKRAYTGQQFGGGRLSVAQLPSEARKIMMPPKHRYAYPLDKSIRRKISMLSLPYPCAVEDLEVSRDNSTVEGQVRSLPTALIKSEVE